MYFIVLGNSTTFVNKQGSRTEDLTGRIKSLWPCVPLLRAIGASPGQQFVTSWCNLQL